MSDPLDVARAIFINDESELRSGWRVLAFVFIFLLASLLLAVLIKALATVFPTVAFLAVDPPEADSTIRNGLISLFVSNLGNLVAAVIATAICARGLERRSLASVGFKLHREWPGDFALGTLMGGATLAIAVGIATAAGAYTFEVHVRSAGSLAGGLGIVVLFFLIAGAAEELIFRGFPFQALAHNLGGASAVAISSVIFGLAHLSNPNATTISTINTILAGVWLGLAYLITRSLWLATALHWSWNFATMFIFGLPVSGFTTLDQFSWLRGSAGTPLWVSGGSYGPEGGLAATAAVILSTLAIWKSGLFRVSGEMKIAIIHGKREPVFVSVTPRDTEVSEELGSE